MKTFANQLIILLVALISVSQASKLALYESPIWKESLAFDAPVIEPEETLKLLKQLLHLVPTDKNHYLDDDERTPDSIRTSEYGKEDAKWDENMMNGITRGGIKNLIDLARTNRKYPCDHAYYYFYEDFDEKDDHKTHLTSIDGQKGYGANIQAFVAHYKKEMAKKCAKITYNSDLLEKLADEFIPSEGELNGASWRAISSKAKLANGVSNLLKKNVEDFNEKVKHSKTREEIHEKFKSLKDECDKLLDGFSFLRKVFSPKNGDSELEKFFKDHDLVQRAVQLQACKGIKEETIKDHDVDADIGLGSSIYHGVHKLV